MIKSCIYFKKLCCLMQTFESPRVDMYTVKFINYPFFYSLMHPFVHPHNVKYKTIISEPLIVLCEVTKKRSSSLVVPVFLCNVVLKKNLAIRISQCNAKIKSNNTLVHSSWKVPIKYFIINKIFNNNRCHTQFN